MTVLEMSRALPLTVLTMPDGEREVEGVYIGDLLSWVMGRAESGQVWVTIMSNLNILAVATLSDVSCILLCEGVTLEETVRKTAEEKGINILSAAGSAYDVARELARMGV